MCSSDLGRSTPARWTGLVFAVATLAVALGVAMAFQPGGEQFQFVESHTWIPAFGAGYTLGVDGIALVLTLLTAGLVPLLIVAGWHDDRAPFVPLSLRVFAGFPKS